MKKTRAFATLVRMFYNQGLADQLETLANDFGTLAASSSLPSCYHCVVIIHAKLGLPHYRPSPLLQSPPPGPRADLPHAACRRGRDGLGP